jgi:hypothetical protein
MQLHFVLFKTSHLPQYYYFFLKPGLNTRSLAKNQIIRTLLRVSTKRPKIGYSEPKIRGTKTKKVRQKCHLLIFFMIFSQFIHFLIYWYKSMQCCTKVIYFLYRGHNLGIGDGLRGTKNATAFF